MVFDPVDIVVDIEVKKEMLIKQNSNDEDVNSSEIQLIVNVKNPLDELIFFTKNIVDTEDKSKEIYDILNTN